MNDLKSIHLSDQTLTSYSSTDTYDTDGEYITLLDQCWQSMCRADWKELIESILKQARAEKPRS